MNTNIIWNIPAIILYFNYLYLIIIPGTNVTEMKGNGSSLQGVYSLQQKWTCKEQYNIMWQLLKWEGLAK